MIDLLLANSEIIYTIVVVSLVFVLGFWLIPLLKNKGYLKDNDVATTSQILKLLELLIAELKISKDKKDEILIIFQISQIAVNYVEQTMNTVDNIEKKRIATQTVFDILTQMKIPISEERKRLIGITIESAVSQLPSTK